MYVQRAAPSRPVTSRGGPLIPPGYVTSENEEVERDEAEAEQRERRRIEASGLGLEEPIRDVSRRARASIDAEIMSSNQLKTLEYAS